MIDRYTRPQMGRIWSEEYKFQKWLEIEILACEARAQLGEIPPEAVERIKRKAKFQLDRIQELERITHHDVVAFLTAVGDSLGEDARYLHLGMTSYDVLDTALSLRLKEAADLIIQGLKKLQEVLREKAQLYKNTVIIGRTHGIHAEPTTFGLKLALWYEECRRNQDRIQRIKELISYGKISGAVGTFATVPPSVEEYVCQKLGLLPAPISSQIISRDRHAEYLTSLAIVAGSLEKFATEIRNLQRTEILEMEEPFARGQKGSSAMPHKRNPIVCEQICGLARLVRAYAMAALENISLWHERDLTHSSVERVILPDSTILVDYILHRFREVVRGLMVYPENMRFNLEKTGGLIFSQRVLLALMEKGLPRDQAYQLVQRNALAAWENKCDFRNLLRQDTEVGQYLNPQELEACFDLDYYLKYVEFIFSRVFH